jgi:hypothetical protein
LGGIKYYTQENTTPKINSYTISKIKHKYSHEKIRTGGKQPKTLQNFKTPLFTPNPQLKNPFSVMI